MNRRIIDALALFALLFVGAACQRGVGGQAPAGMSEQYAARLQIAELVARFSDAANRHDWEAMAELYADDAIWETAAGKLGFRYQGRAAIRKFLLENPNGVEVLAYTTTTPFIETLSDERARTRLNMTEYLRILATGETKRIVGVYEDELIKRRGRWQFAHRSFTLRITFDEKPALL